MTLRQTCDKTCDKLVTRSGIVAAVLILGLWPVLSGAQTISPKGYPPGKEPYYYYSENSAWYDSYGRLRYGPQGIPADEYKARQKALQRQEPPPIDLPQGSAPSGGSSVKGQAVATGHALPTAGNLSPQQSIQPTKKPGIPWGRMFWPGGVPPQEAHKGLIDWH